jgi:UPF0271 protein
MKKRIFVLDACGIMRSTMDFSSGGFRIPDSVYRELLSESSKTAIDASILRGDVVRASPDDVSLLKASDAARETGDISRLSSADLDVLALALESNATIVSDDYAIQNTARLIGVTVVPVTQDGIRKQVSWVWSCSGCGRSMSQQGECDVCGHRAKRHASAP